MLSFLTGLAPMQPISYLFIDGESLNQIFAKLSENYFDGTKIPLSWPQVRGSHRKVFYFDAIPVQLAGEDDNTYATRIAPKREELSFIERQSGFHVRTGDVRHRRRRGNEQKMVDVQLAVDALLMASRGLFATCTLVTGDLDFKPLISALVDMGIDVTLSYPEGETNEQLRVAADTARPLDVLSCLNWIDSSFSLKSRVPTSFNNLQSAEQNISELVHRWSDTKYGICSIGRSQNSDLRVITEIEPNNPTTHRLEITAKNVDLLRHYARDAHGLEIPPH